MLGKVLRTYLSNAPQLLATLRTACVRDDASSIRQTAHTFKSSSANVGAMVLAAHCKEIEAMGRANTLVNVHTMLAHLEEEYTAVQAALTAELNTAVVSG